jgi:hypothetical protein
MSAELKSLVARIVRDAAFRKAFLTKPGTVIDGLPVSPAERRALDRARRRLVLASPDGSAAFIPVEWP